MCCCAGRGGGCSVDGCVRVECLRVLQYCCCVCPAAAISLTRATAGGYVSYVSVVDLYNSATGAWSTAVLSVARAYLAAASVGNVALFAGGVTGGALLCRENGGVGLLIVFYVERFRMLPSFGSASPETA